MRIPSEWESAAAKESDLDELKKLLKDKNKELNGHRLLQRGLESRIELLENMVLTQKVELEDAEKTIKRLKGNEFTDTIRRNQEGTLMRITSFLNGALINDIEQDKVRERVGDRKLTIDQRLEALMGEMNRVREDARRSRREEMDLRSRLNAEQYEHRSAKAKLAEITEILIQMFECFFSTVKHPEVDGFIPTVDRLQRYVQENHKSVFKTTTSD